MSGERSVMIDLALIERLRADQVVQEHVCCPACVRVAEVLAVEGKHDLMYDRLDGRCCCRASLKQAQPQAPVEGEL